MKSGFSRFSLERSLGLRRNAASICRAIMLGLGVGLAACQANAATNTFVLGLSDVFSGTSPALTNTPWVGVMFHDVAPGQVLLTISGLALDTSEDLTGLYLNLNPSLNPNKLTFAEVSETAGFAPPTISKGVDKFRAAGSGKYDVRFTFDNALNDRFSTADSATFLVSGIATLTAADFEFLSSSPGGSGSFYSAAYIQHLGDCDPPGWIGTREITPVPEPSANLLLAGGFGIWFGWMVRRLAAAGKLQPVYVRPAARLESKSSNPQNLP